MDEGMILWWQPTKPQEVMHCSHSPSSRINLEALFGSEWEQTAFVQFLCVDQDTVQNLRQEFADVPNLGGNYDPHMPPMREVPAALGRDQDGPVDMDEEPDREKRARSKDGSENPRPRGIRRITREERQQATADGNLDEVDWDELSEGSE
jgi:hypothetical protein